MIVSISPQQQEQIIQYLRKRNLSEDTLIEVFDHFLYQVEDFIEKGKTFEEAFENTKIIWANDLENVWVSYLYQVPKIQKKKIESISRVILKKSFGYSLILSILVLGAVFTLKQENFTELYPYFAFFMMELPIVFVSLTLKTLLWGSIPFRRKMIATEDLFSPIFSGLFAGISSIHMGRIVNIENIASQIYQQDIGILLMLLALSFAQSMMAFYMIFTSLKCNQDIRNFKKNHP